MELNQNVEGDDVKVSSLPIENSSQTDHYKQVIKSIVYDKKQNIDYYEHYYAVLPLKIHNFLDVLPKLSSDDQVILINDMINAIGFENLSKTLFNLDGTPKSVNSWEQLNLLSEKQITELIMKCASVADKYRYLFLDQDGYKSSERSMYLGARAMSRYLLKLQNSPKDNQEFLNNILDRYPIFTLDSFDLLTSADVDYDSAILKLRSTPEVHYAIFLLPRIFEKGIELKSTSAIHLAERSSDAEYILSLIGNIEHFSPLGKEVFVALKRSAMNFGFFQAPNYRRAEWENFQEQSLLTLIAKKELFNITDEDIASMDWVVKQGGGRGAAWWKNMLTGNRERR